MRDKYGVEQDSYCYPDSTVLINLLNIQNESLLEEAEIERVEMSSVGLPLFALKFSYHE